MRTKLIVAAMAAQVLLLGFMAGEREAVLHTGRVVTLRTAPIDPRDPMRGDYVRLSYDFTEVPKALCRDGVATWFGEENTDWRYRRSFRDARVYAVLRETPDGVIELTGLTDRRPSGGLFLRGRVDNVDNDAVRVRYGVEAIFMEQGKAKALEDAQRGENAGVPLAVEVAVRGDGLTVIRGWEWEPLGIRLALEPRREDLPRNATEAERRLRAVTVELFNRGDAPLAIVDRAGGASLRLLTETRWGWENGAWVHADRTRPAPKPDEVVLLAPGESRKIRVDLTAPEWDVWHREREKDAPERKSLSQLNGASNLWFRFEYVPPTGAESAGLPHTKLIRHVPLRSRGFNAAFAID